MAAAKKARKRVPQQLVEHPYHKASVRLDRLLMDSENPRHEPLSSEPEIIAWLVKNEAVLPLAKTIVEMGDLSPLENVGVYPHPTKRGYYVVAEGNRRVCALTLLRDPDRSPTTTLKRTFSALRDSTTYALPHEIEVAVFDSEQAALPWKTLRHSGEQGGAGTRKWKALQIARNLKKVGQATADNAAIELMDYAEASGIITRDQREKIPLTTVTRHISNPVLRDALGLASAKEFTIQAPVEQVDKALQVFLADAFPANGNEPAVNSRNKKQDIETYAAKLRSDGHAITTRLAAAFTPKPTVRKRTRHNRSPNDRNRVVPRDFVANIKNRALKRIFDELRNIPISGDPDFPFAANYLMRAFIELLVNAYAKDHGLSLSGKVHDVAKRCIEALQNDAALQTNAGGKAKLTEQLKAWRVLYGDVDSWLSPHTMGSGVHGNMVPTQRDLVARWDNLETGTSYLLAGLK